jgi:RND family efflux transporter MFP subunit
LRSAAKWGVVVLAIGFLIFKFKFAPAPVLSAEARSGAILAEVMGTGTLEARVKTTISPRIQERLREVLADQNDFVKAGQTLFRLDDGELRRQVEMAEAGLAAAEATAARVQVDEQRAEAVALQARQDHKRIAELLTTQVSSQADLDKAVEQLGVAEADLKRAHSATLEADAQVAMAEKTLAYHRERLGFAEVASPYDGLVVRRDRDPGGVVVPGSSVLQLISTNEIWVSAWVDEAAMAGLAVGQPAQVVFRSEPGKPYRGEVARLGRETDRETREFIVDVRLQELPPRWTIGQRAEVFIETGRKANTTLVPQRFLNWQEGQPGVFIAQDGSARWQRLTLGLRGRDEVEVIEGLAPGDRVVMARDPKQPALKEGVRVKPTVPPTPREERSPSATRRPPSAT